METLDSSSRREFVRQRANQRCEYCQIPEEEFHAATAFHEEHIKPRVLFSADDPEVDSLSNLAWACPRCNLSKHDKSEAVDPKNNESTPMFNPREDTWSEHFKAHKSGNIVGLTIKGRATVEALRFNNEERVRNRFTLFLRGLWPAPGRTKLQARTARFCISPLESN